MRTLEPALVSVFPLGPDAPLRRFTLAIHIEQLLIIKKMLDRAVAHFPETVTWVPEKNSRTGIR